ncbi:MAG: hypothetical protein JWP08_2604 [Bryobacterales bacterium]|nr:hypothetical protein [Bryobacterales bacterium]
MSRHYQFQILGPKFATYEPAFADFTVDEALYRSRLDSLQRLRGRLYLEDGAIGEESLDREGRFRMCGDEEAWHLLLTDCENNLIGCARYLIYPNSVPYTFLRISHSGLGKDPRWSLKLRAAVEADLRLACHRGLLYVEIGGWALAEEWRMTKAALETAVGSYALARLWGGTLGSCTATVRHGSASILRRLGGSSLVVNGEALPSYFDSRYGCMMELLRFDYVTPARRISPMIDVMETKLASLEVVTARVEYSRVGWGAEAPEIPLRDTG